MNFLLFCIIFLLFITMNSALRHTFLPRQSNLLTRTLFSRSLTTLSSSASPLSNNFFNIRGGASGSKVIEVKTTNEVNALVNNKEGKLVVFDFTATWCPPCKQIAPFYNKLAEEKSNVIFAKVDVDESPEVVEAFRVSSMPTFVFSLNGKTVYQFSGANQGLLLDTIEKFSKN